MKREALRRQVKSQTRALRREIAGFDLLAWGTILTRTKICGRKSCPCASDPARRHGPYHEWSRVEDGRLAHTILSPEQAELLRAAIANFRRLEELLEQWKSETVGAVLALRTRKGQGAG